MLFEVPKRAQNVPISGIQNVFRTSLLKDQSKTTLGRPKNQSKTSLGRPKNQSKTSLGRPKYHNLYILDTSPERGKIALTCGLEALGIGFIKVMGFAQSHGFLKYNILANLGHFCRCYRKVQKDCEAWITCVMFILNYTTHDYDDQNIVI